MASTEKHASDAQSRQRQQGPRNVMPSVTVVGARLREARERLDLRQEWVADQLGIHQERYSRYETGRTKHPSPEHLVALAKLYGFPDDHFVAMVGFRSGADLLSRLPPEGAIVIKEPRAGLVELMELIEAMTDAQFAKLFNHAESLVSQRAGQADETL